MDAPIVYLSEASSPLFDKGQHAAAGAAFGAADRALAKGQPLRERRVQAYLRAAALALGKEAFDRSDSKHHTCDPYDAATTFAGYVCAYEGCCVAPLVSRGTIGFQVNIQLP